MEDVTQLLTRWRGGDGTALDALTPLVYAELRQLASHYMRDERPDHTLQPTALVHEAYLRLTGARQPDFHNRVHFYGAAATTMRRILVDHARGRGAAKRGGDCIAVSFDEGMGQGIDVNLDLLALSEALDNLARVAPQPARVVELRYFGGLTVEESAEVLDVAPVTIKRHWAFARAWLYRALTPPPAPAGGGA